MNIKRLIFVGLFLFTSLFASVAYSIQSFKVSDIKVDGLQRVSLGAVLLDIPVRVGSAMNDQQASEVIKSLFATGNFDDVQVSNKGSVLIITVQERPTIASLTFSGNKSIETEQLEKNTDASGLRVGEPLNRPLLKQLSKALEDYYYNAGRYRATVQPVVTPLPRNRVDVKFVFTEGPSAEIQQINFVGNKDFDSETLRSQFDLQSTNSAWWKFWSQKQYQKQILSGDLEKLRSFYVNNGYLKFQVNDVQVSVSPDKAGVYINITLTEGKQYKLKEIKFRGQRSEENGLSPSELELFSKLVRFYPDEVYNGAKVTALEEAIKYQLGNTGFAYPEVKTIPVFDEKASEVTLTMFITKGGRAYVHEVKFEGNTVTKDSVLRREMRQFEGTWLNSSSVEAGKRRLNRTGFFEEVNVETVRVPNSDGEVDVIYKVTEANTGSLNFSVGYGTETGASIQAGIQEKNFLGSGNQVGFSVMRDEYQQSASISYRNPYFTPNGVSFGTQLYYNYYRGNQDYVVDYKNDNYGIAFTWGWPLTENIYTEIGVGYRINKLKEFANNSYYYQLNRFLSAHQDQMQNSEEYLNNGIIGDIKLQDFPLTWRLIHNTLNNPTFPTSGNNQRLNLTVTTPGSDSTYYKAQYDVRQYFPLTRSKNFSLLVRGRLGYAQGYGSVNGEDELVPFYDNFYLGGSDTIRGFSTSSLGPKAVYCNPGQCVTNGGQDSSNAVGGNATAVASIELFFPLPFGDTVNRQVRTSFFIDAGSLWDTTYTLQSDKITPYGDRPVLDYSDPNHIRASAGISFQWMSPLGPLVFALARPIKSYEGDDEQVFSFNIGTSF